MNPILEKCCGTYKVWISNKYYYLLKAATEKTNVMQNSQLNNC